MNELSGYSVTLLYKYIANRSLESSKYIENINQDSITNSEEKNFANIKKAFFTPFDFPDFFNLIPP